ncbi:hypothetical protein M0805_008635 [Coniferiporia weirii]|nr:hypothetical protein M0805_008635 [Coniferiporia weirii]
MENTPHIPRLPSICLHRNRHPQTTIHSTTSRPNRRPPRIRVKWTGYPSSENQWLPETELSHASKILKTYKKTRNL